MNEEELKEIMLLLEEAGWQPQLCDTPLPAYESVHAGNPTEPEQLQDFREKIWNKIYNNMPVYIFQHKTKSPFMTSWMLTTGLLRNESTGSGTRQPSPDIISYSKNR